MKNRFKYLILATVCSCAIGVLTIFALYIYVAPRLPSIDSLKNVQYQVPLSIYSRDNKLIAQYGNKKRRPIHIEEVPEMLINAFLAAEDQDFFNHPGVDYKGLLRAAFKLLKTGKKKQGGSTITMQVARNFFLSRKKTFTRKFKEIFLSLKIERQLSKREILDLYLNKIYLGHRSYGIQAAAYVYYGKGVADLNLAQWAMIAGLPKAPSSYNPISNADKALGRRNQILRRMHRLNFIDGKQYQQATKQPVSAHLHSYKIGLKAPYIAEMVRNQIVQRYNEQAYTGGYKVFTSIDSQRQNDADTALRTALHQYDERHGYRSPEKSVDNILAMTTEQWNQTLKNIPIIGSTRPGIVISIENQSVYVYTEDKTTVELSWDNIKWARPYRSTNKRGANPKRPEDILHPGDIIRVRQTEENTWRLAQIPQPEGALISINPENGAIMALVGGYDFKRSKFNRATQIKRQPGSGFKPILYTTALEKGYTAASTINDAPIVSRNPSSGEDWRPQNYSGKFYGPTRLRVALRKSRNLVSIRLLQQLGVEQVISTAERFGFRPAQLPHGESLALGSGSAAPVDMARMFATFANGGFRIEPYFIDRIESIDGDILYQATPATVCKNCTPEQAEKIANPAPRIISPQVHYIMHSLLQDVVRRGTGRKAMKLGRNDLAGKTGTTNDQRDAWFNGYSPAIVTNVWVGFDSAKPLGNKETGGKAALPAWMKYMEKALADIPEQSFIEPDNMVTVSIAPETGNLANAETENAVMETFRTQFVPKQTDHYFGADLGQGTDFEDSDMQSLF